MGVEIVALACSIGGMILGRVLTKTEGLGEKHAALKDYRELHYRYWLAMDGISRIIRLSKSHQDAMRMAEDVQTIIEARGEDEERRQHY